MSVSRILRVAALLGFVPALAVSADGDIVPLGSGVAPELAIRFVASEAGALASGDRAALDLGSLSALSTQRRGRSALVVRRRIGVRLESPTGRTAVARLWVSLTHETPGCTVRIDGLPVSALPRLLDSVRRVGVTVVHEIEIAVSAEAAAGPLLDALEWRAETD